MTIKLHISKAYDRIEERYLVIIMRRLGLAEQWINKIMLCVSTITYFALVDSN